MMRAVIFLVTISLVVGCATLTNDAFVPIALSFSDGSDGSCELSNKRFAETVTIPGTPKVRRSDDHLQFRCETTDGREAFGSIPSTMGGKIVASAVFLDLGIVDAFTDKHRNYPASYVIPINKK